jgi:hypothetical protein
MKSQRRSRVELFVRVPIRGAEEGLISSSNSTGLQVKLLDLTGVVRMLPSGREGVRVNGFPRGDISDNMPYRSHAWG